MMGIKMEDENLITNIINKYKSKWHEMSVVAKASIALIIAKFFQKGLAMITSPIFTRIMPIDEYGIISTFTSWQSVLYIIATLNMAQGVFNNGMVDFKEDREKFCFSILCLANTCTFICFLIFLLLKNIIVGFIDMPYYLLIVMFLYFLVTPAYNYWMGKQRYEFKYKAITLVMIASSLISTVLAIIVVAVVPDEIKAISKLTVTEGISIIIGCFFYIYLMTKSKGKISLNYWKYALKLNLPLIPHYLSLYVLASSDRIMISKMVNTSATAIYNISYTVATIMLIFWNSIEASYAPWIYQKLENKNDKAIRKRANQIILFFAFCTVTSALFAPEIIRILAPSNYYSGIYIIPSVACGVFFTAVYSLYMRVELYFKKNKFTMFASVIAAIINLVLNYIFIPKFGMYAAGYTTLICYIVLAVLHYLNLKRLKLSYMYDNKRIAVISISILVSSVIISYIYKYNMIRYVTIVILFICAIIKRKEIIKIIKNKEKE